MTGLGAIGHKGAYCSLHPNASEQRNVWSNHALTALFGPGGDDKAVPLIIYRYVQQTRAIGQDQRFGLQTDI